jgi:hypothetical protein
MIIPVADEIVATGKPKLCWQRLAGKIATVTVFSQRMVTR